MARKGRVDGARDLLDLMGQHAQDSSKQVLPQLDTGTIIMINDAADGTVVQLDNMQVAASDCNLLGTHAPVVGDRVMVLVHMEEFWILGGIKGEATGSSSGPPSGSAGGDLAGTYPNPTVKASVGLTGAPTAATAAPGTSTTQVASTAFVGAAIAALGLSLDPPGTMKLYAGSVAPTGYLVCDGSSQLRATYPTLSTLLLAEGWGSVDGTHFNLPDFRGRVPIGVGTGDASDATAHALGQKTGTEGAALTSVGQMPSHHHGSATAGLISPPTITTGAPSTNTTAGPSTNTSDGPSPDATNAGGVLLPNAGTAGTVLNPGTLLIGSQWGSAISAGVTGHSNADGKTNHQHTLSAHTHTMGNHTHTMGNHTHSSTMPSHDHTITAQGNSDPHPNVQPSLAVNYIIKT